MTVEPPEDFEQYSDGDQLDLEPGDTITGVVLSIQEGKTENGPWYKLGLKIEDGKEVTYFAKGDAKRAIANGDVETAQEVWVGVEEEPETFEDGDGEEQEYYPHRFAIKE